MRAARAARARSQKQRRESEQEGGRCVSMHGRGSKTVREAFCYRRALRAPRDARSYTFNAVPAPGSTSVYIIRVLL